MSVTLAKDVILDRITWGDGKTCEKKHVLQIPISYNENAFIIQLPELVCINGMDKSNVMTLTTSKRDARESVHAFMSVLNSIHEGSTKRVREFDSRYDVKCGAMNSPEDLRFTLNIPVNEKAEFVCPVVDAQGKTLDVSALQQPNLRITAITQCVGTWCVAGRVGFSWKTLYVRADRPSTAPRMELLSDERIGEGSDDEESDDVLVCT